MKLRHRKTSMQSKHPIFDYHPGSNFSIVDFRFQININCLPMKFLRGFCWLETKAASSP